MSAWIVSKAHIDAIVWALGKRELFPDGMGPDEVGTILWRENHRSINYRYDEERETPPYTYAVPPVQWTPDQLTKILGCYDYQTCETADYRETAAGCLVDELQRALKRGGAHEGSAEAETAPWGICECGGAHADYQHDSIPPAEPVPLANWLLK